MEIDFDGDVEFLNDLLRGIESKVGAAVPICLLQPILAGCTNPAGGASTPILEDTEKASPSEDRQSSHDDAANQTSSPSQTATPPAKEFLSNHRQVEENCQRLKSDMDALRKIDVSLMKQLLNVYDSIEEVRWMIDSYDMSDSCESLSSSVYESIEQIHEKWVTSERRQWQSASSKDLTSWRDDSRYNIHRVGRLNSTGSRERNAESVLYGLSKRWRSPNTDLNRSFPQVTAAWKSNLELHRRSSVDHLPIASPASKESPSASPIGTRKRRSSSGAVDKHEAAVDGKIGEDDTTPKPSSRYIKKPKFLFHSQSSPSFDAQLQWVEVTDTTVI